MATKLLALTDDRPGGIFIDADLVEGVSVTSGGVEIPFASDRPGGLYIDAPTYDFFTESGPHVHPAPSADLLVGFRGRVDLTYRLYASNMHGEKLYEILDYSDAAVDLSNYRDHTWELSFLWAHENHEQPEDIGEGGWVKVEAELLDKRANPSPGGYTFPLGLYRIGEMEHVSTQAVSLDRVVARSPEDTLLDDNAHLGYSAMPGDGVLAKTRDILLDRGFLPERIALPPLGEDKELATGMYFDPIEDHSGTYWLRIINAMLNARGFFALYTDREGRFTTHAVVDRQDRTPDVLYSSDPDSEAGEEWGIEPDLMVEGELSVRHETEGFQNRVVVMSTDVNTVPPIYVIVENRDPNSPNSIQNRGIRTGEPISLSNIATREDAEAIGRAEIAKRSGIDRRVSMSTIPDPRRGPRETYLLDISSEEGERVSAGLHFVTGWQLALSTDEGAMTHELTTLEPTEGEVV